MGEPIAGRISTEAKQELEQVAERRGVSISELTGSIVTLWLRENSVGAADDPDDAREDRYADGFEDLAGQVETLRHVQGLILTQIDHNIKGWVVNQAHDERRAYDDLEEPDVPVVESMEEARNLL